MSDGYFVDGAYSKDPVANAWQTAAYRSIVPWLGDGGASRRAVRSWSLTAK